MKVDFFIDKDTHHVQLGFGDDKDSAKEVFHFLRANKTIGELLVDGGIISLEFTVCFHYGNDDVIQESSGWDILIDPIISGTKEFQKFVEDFVAVFAKTRLKFSTMDSDELEKAIKDLFKK